MQKINDIVFKLLIESKDQSIVILNATGHVLSWNTGAEGMFGYKAEDIVGKPFSVFYGIENVNSGLPNIHLQSAIEKGRYEFEILKYKSDQTTFYSHTTLAAWHNDDEDSIKGFVQLTSDISLQKKLEKERNDLNDQLEEKIKQRTKELLTVNKELEAFSYSVSHDLKVPLRAITGYSAMLKKDYQGKLDAEANRLINVIVDKAKIMGMLINDLLSFSRMSRLHIVSEDIDMKRLAENCMAELLQDETPQKYTVDIHNLPACSGDLSMLKQVWFNLLSNAIKYSSKTAQPHIEAGTIEGNLMNVYYVKDNGAGFEMKYAKNLFGVFQRLHREDEFEGTGLGLALAKRIVSKHGGDLWAEAELNKGAVFYFNIPKKQTSDGSEI